MSERTPMFSVWPPISAMPRTHRRSEETRDLVNKMAWTALVLVIAVLGSGLTVIGQIVFNKVFVVLK